MSTDGVRPRRHSEIAADTLSAEDSTLPYSNTLLRMCVVGDVAVGKTSLTARFMNGTFCDVYKPTCLVAYFHKLVQTPDRNVFVQIWDTAGQERHRSLSPHIVRDTRSAMLVYDVTNRTSFEEVKRYWLGWIWEHAPPGVRLTLVGNKSDLDTRSELRQVSRKEAMRFAEANGMLFYETSAKTGKNVDVAFLDGVHLLADSVDDDNQLTDSIHLHSQPEKQEDKKGQNDFRWGRCC